MIKKLLLIICALCLVSCAKEGDKTPLGWCIWEIQKHEGYEDCAYTYSEIYYKDMQEESTFGGRVESYIITTYIYPVRTEWFCFIEYNKHTYKKYLNEDDIYAIDCDIVWEENYD